MASWVQVSHNGSEYVVTTYLENVKVSEVMSQEQGPAWSEIQNRLTLLKGLAKGKVFTSIGK